MRRATPPVLPAGRERDARATEQDRRGRGGLAACGDLPHVDDVRTIGAVGVVELTRPVQVDAATEAALDAGVWLRPFRNLIYTMPPYICTDDEIDRICAAIDSAATVG